MKDDEKITNKDEIGLRSSDCPEQDLSDDVERTACEASDIDNQYLAETTQLSGNEDGQSPNSSGRKRNLYLILVWSFIVVAFAAVLLINHIRSRDQVDEPSSEKQEQEVSIFGLIDAHDLSGLDKYLDRFKEAAYDTSINGGPVIHAVKTRNVDALKVLLKHFYLPQSVVTGSQAWETMKYCMYRPLKLENLHKYDDIETMPSLDEAYDGVGTEMATLLLDAGVSVDTKNPSTGRPLISQAVLWGNVSIMKLLESRGANVETADNDGNSPIMYCAYYDLTASTQGYRDAINELRVVIDPNSVLNDEELTVLYRVLIMVVMHAMIGDYEVNLNRVNKYNENLAQMAYRNYRFEVFADIHVENWGI